MEGEECGVATIGEDLVIILRSVAAIRAIIIEIKATTETIIIIRTDGIIAAETDRRVDRSVAVTTVGEIG